MTATSISIINSHLHQSVSSTPFVMPGEGGTMHGLSSGLEAVVWLNGVYDVACALSLLLFPGTPLATLHLGMFYGGTRLHLSITQRMCAHVCFLNGVIRMCAPYCGTGWGKTGTERACVLRYLLAASYWLEAIFWAMEILFFETVYSYPACMTVALSLFLGILCM